MKIQTTHKTFNKKLKKEIINLFPNFRSYNNITLFYEKIVLIRDENKKIIARIEQGKKRNGLIIISH